MTCCERFHTSANIAGPNNVACCCERLHGPLQLSMSETRKLEERLSNQMLMKNHGSVFQKINRRREIISTIENP